MAYRLLSRACVADLELIHLRKVYPGQARPVIPDLDLAIRSRELVVLVGPSGCGKSTTLRMIAGLEEPTQGAIRIAGRDVTQLPPSDRDIAMVFQSYALYPHMSVFENMAFGLRIRSVPFAEIERRVRAAAASLGLDAYLDRRPKELSGGQRQRVAIGRAVVRQPKVFLFDEPLSNLDAKLRSDMRREIARVHRESGATAVYVTHDQIEAMTLADRIVVLDQGIVLQRGTPAEIYDRPANRFVAGFFGTPAMNFLSPRGPGFAIPLPDRARDAERVIVGVRPEQLSLQARSPDGIAVPGDVAMREVLGAEVVLHVESAAGPLTVRTDAHATPRPGETVQVWLDPRAIHVFDGITEQRL